MALELEVQNNTNAIAALNRATADLKARADRVGDVIPAEASQSNKLADRDWTRQAVEDGVNRIVADAPETLDTLKEVADWIENDETGTAAMVADIVKNRNDIAGEVTRAKEAETGLSDRVDDLEADAETFVKSVNGKTPDAAGNVVLAGGLSVELFPALDPVTLVDYAEGSSFTALSDFNWFFGGKLKDNTLYMTSWHTGNTPQFRIDTEGVSVDIQYSTVDTHPYQPGMCIYSLGYPSTAAYTGPFILITGGNVLFADESWRNPNLYKGGST